MDGALDNYFADFVNVCRIAIFRFYPTWYNSLRVDEIL